MHPTLQNLLDAVNAHDPEAMAAQCEEGYRSEQPLHPERAFVGSAQVRANWTAMFAGIPDFRAEVVADATEGSTVWSEWRWSGTRTDGSPLRMAGVIVFGAPVQRFAWARLYVDDVVDLSGTGDITTAVQDISGGRLDR